MRCWTAPAIERHPTKLLTTSTGLRPFVLATLATAGLLVGQLTAAESSGTDASDEPRTVSYWTEVRPIFQVHCQGCHQPAKSGGSYVMTEFESLLAGGDSGDAIVPGDIDASYLMDLIVPTDGVAEMPKGKEPLSESQLSLIRNWIEQGAHDDTPASARLRYDADNPPAYAAPPVVTAVQFSPDGNVLAVSGYHEVLVHNVQQAVGGEESLVGTLDWNV